MIVPKSKLNSENRSKTYKTFIEFNGENSLVVSRHTWHLNCLLYSYWERCLWQESAPLILLLVCQDHDWPIKYKTYRREEIKFVRIHQILGLFRGWAWSFGIVKQKRFLMVKQSTIYEVSKFTPLQCSATCSVWEFLLKYASAKFIFIEELVVYQH